jgi:nucleotide-binding universal stress UspA family protein
MIKRILVGLAGTEYTDVAIRRAVELAQLHDAELTGVTIVPKSALAGGEPMPIGAGGLAVQLREQKAEVTRLRLETATEHFVAACEAAGLCHRLEHEEGDPFGLMLSYCRYHDLTVFGLRSIFEYYFEDQDSSELLERLIRGGMRPIIAVSKQFRCIQRVLIAYSGSVESANAMRRFVQLGLWPDVELRIVTGDDAEGEPDDLLRAASQFCRAHGYEAETEHLSGPAGPSLLSHAEQWDADLIVMGNSARNVLLKKVFGATALHVMRNANRPLFLAQ